MRTLRRQAGFTMIEVMVAFMLTAVATSGLLALYSIETRSSGYSRHATEAAMLAQDQLERLRTQATPTSSTTGSQTTLDEKGKVISTGLYTRSWTITVGTSYADLAVTVAWTEDGTGHQVVMRGRRNL